MREGNADYLLGEPLTEETLRGAIAFIAGKKNTHKEKQK